MPPRQRFSSLVVSSHAHSAFARPNEATRRLCSPRRVLLSGRVRQQHCSTDHDGGGGGETATMTATGLLRGRSLLRTREGGVGKLIYTWLHHHEETKLHAFHKYRPRCRHWVASGRLIRNMQQPRAARWALLLLLLSLFI